MQSQNEKSEVQHSAMTQLVLNKWKEIANRISADEKKINEEMRGGEMQ